MRSRAAAPSAAAGGEPAPSANGVPHPVDQAQALEDMDARELEEWVAQSPWVDLSHPVGFYEAIKCVFMLPVVLVKAVLLMALQLVAWAGVRLVLLGKKPGSGPLARWQLRFVQSWVSFWARAFLLVCGFWWIRVEGWEHVAAAHASRAILCFNHPSYVDPIVMGWLFAPCGVAKAGAARVLFIGSLGRALGFVFVARRGALDAENRHVLRTDPIAAIRDRAADPRYPLMMIAPEGTTKPQKCLLRFARGAFAAGRPVLPVLLDYRFRHHNPGWGCEWTLFHMYRTLAQFSNTLVVRILPPVAPAPEEEADPSAFAARVRGAMGGALGVPLVEQGLPEVMALARRGVTTNLRGSRVLVPEERAKAKAR